jgi:pimeloyl-ACP methyl ester carboxylesterase
MTRILYLHGFASGPSSSKARYFRTHLEAAGAQVDVPDLAAGDFEHLTISSQLVVIERAAAGKPVVLIGSSMGGYLAAIYAARHPEIPRLVLLAPAFGFARRWPERLGAANVAEWRRAGTMEVFHYGENRNRSLSYNLLDDAARYEEYPDFNQPALIFHGAHDDVVPSSYSEQFAAAHPSVKLEILDSGHELLNVLDYMAPKVANFLLGGLRID